MTGEVEQIITTAWKQHQRGELGIFELEALREKYGVEGFVIDGDHLGEGERPWLIASSQEMTDSMNTTTNFQQEEPGQKVLVKKWEDDRTPEQMKADREMIEDIIRKVPREIVETVDTLMEQQAIMNAIRGNRRPLRIM